MLYVLANNIRSLYNVGALYRLCDAVGVNTLYLTGITGAPFEDLKHQRQHQQIAKTALEGLHNVSWQYFKDPLEVVNLLKAKDVQIVALEQTDHSQPYTKAAFQPSICLVLGHEADGVQSDLLEQADLAIEIPMYGHGRSLNVISAASIALYHIRNQI